MNRNIIENKMSTMLDKPFCLQKFSCVKLIVGYAKSCIGRYVNCTQHIYLYIHVYYNIFV